MTDVEIRDLSTPISLPLRSTYASIDNRTLPAAAPLLKYLKNKQISADSPEMFNIFVPSLRLILYEHRKLFNMAQRAFLEYSIENEDLPKINDADLNNIHITGSIFWCDIVSISIDNYRKYINNDKGSIEFQLTEVDFRIMLGFEKYDFL